MKMDMKKIYIAHAKRPHFMKIFLKVWITVCIWGCLLTPLLGEGVDNEINGLQKAYQSARSDTQKINILLEIGQKWRQQNKDSGLFYLAKALPLLQKAQWNKGWGRYYQVMGNTYASMGDFYASMAFIDSSLLYYTLSDHRSEYLNASIYKGIYMTELSQFIEAAQWLYLTLNQLDTLSDSDLYIRTLEVIAGIYNTRGLVQESIPLFQKCLRIAEKTGNERLTMISKANLGQTLAGSGKYDDGLKWLLSTLDYFKSAPKSSKELLSVYFNIAYIYGMTGQHDKAVEFLNLSLELSKKIQNIRYELLVRKNICENYFQMNKEKEGMEEIEILLNEYRKLKDIIGEGKILLMLADRYHLQQQYDAAIDLLQQSQSIFNQHGLLEWEINSLQKMGIAFQEKGLHKTAESNYLKAYSLAQELQNMEEMSKIAGSLSELYELTGNLPKALQFHKLHKEYSDSLQIQSQIHELDKVRFVYEAEAAENRNQILSFENEAIQNEIVRKNRLNKYLIVISILILLLIVLIFRMLHTKRQVQHKEKETGITIRMLRAQMNSHFIFNALGSIHQYVIKGKKEEAGTYLIKFSRLVRQILTNSTKEMVTLEEELEALELYIGLEGMRLDNKFTYSLTVDPSIEADTIMVPPLLVQPFVENAIWHGLARLESNDGHIQIHITREGDHLLFKISDNGIGRVAAATVNTKNGDKSPSLGLQITKDRLDMLNRKFKSGGKVFFKDLDRGLLVELTVPAVANV